MQKFPLIFSDYDLSRVFVPSNAFGHKKDPLLGFTQYRVCIDFNRLNFFCYIRSLMIHGPVSASLVLIKAFLSSSDTNSRAHMEK